MPRNLLEYRDDEAIVGRTMMRNAPLGAARRPQQIQPGRHGTAGASERGEHADHRPPANQATAQMIRDARCELIISG